MALLLEIQLIQQLDCHRTSRICTSQKNQSISELFDKQNREARHKTVPKWFMGW
jgi:hypothetical protein